MTSLQIGFIIGGFLVAVLVEIIGGILVLNFEIPHTFNEYNHTMENIDENKKKSNSFYTVKSSKKTTKETLKWVHIAISNTKKKL